MQQSLVSVVIANHNYGHFIGHAIESVAAQTHGSLELIVVDDGSTDNSVQEVKGLKTLLVERFTEFKLIEQPAKRGFNAALNIGINYVKGDLTILFDSDDIMFPTYVERTVRELLERVPSGVGFVYTNSVLIDNDGNRIQEGLSHSFDAELLQTKSYIPGCAATLTHVLRPIFPLDETITVGGKHLRWQQIVASGYKGMHIAEPLFYYRMHDSNHSGIGKKVIAARDGLGNKPAMLDGYWNPVPLK